MTSDPALNAFLQACGCGGPWVVEVGFGDRVPARQERHQPFAVVGRGKQADLLLEHNEVSRSHAVLQVIGGQVFCFDLGSRTGTHWRDGPRASGWVVPGEPIRIGPFQIRLPPASATCEVPSAMLRHSTSHIAHRTSHVPPAWHPLFPDSGGLLPNPPVNLEFLNGKTQKRQWQVNRVLTLLGSAPACKVRLVSRSVAQIHCYLVATPAGVWVVDLLSTAGVFRNGTPIRFARLEDADQLLLGEFLIRARQGEPAAVAAKLAPGESPGAKWPPGQELQPYSVGQAFQPDLHQGCQAGKPDLQARPGLSLRLASQGEIAQASEAGLLPLMNQFSLMQQQMFDQFQQTMMMMFQMFGTLQQNQMAALRDELDRVHQLTRELQTLQETLERSASQREAVDHPADAASPAPAAGNYIPRSQPRDVAANGPTHPEPQVLPVPIPAAEAAKAATMPAAQVGASPAASAAAPKASPGAPDPANLHAWLYQRMESVRQERQSRWQTILGLLGGKNP